MKITLNLPGTRDQGFSLVELMVAMLLGLLITAGVISIFVANRQVYRTNENLSRLQETARVVNELMGREIRAAGGNPCGTPLVVNVLNNPASNWWSNWTGGTLIGYEGNQAGPRPFGTNKADRVQGTDAVVVISGTARDALTIASHNPGAGQLQLNAGNAGIQKGDILMVCDPFTAAIVQVNQSATQTPPITLAYDTSGGTPGNSNQNLGYPLGTPKNFTGGSLSKLTASFWYVGYNGNGGTSLYRLSISGDGTGKVKTAAQEIVEGVTDMQIQYLTRNGTTPANGYVDASSITDWTNSAVNLVTAARVTLSLQTLEGVGVGRSNITRTLSLTSSIRNREVVQ